MLFLRGRYVLLVIYIFCLIFNLTASIRVHRVCLLYIFLSIYLYFIYFLFCLVSPITFEVTLAMYPKFSRVLEEPLHSRLWCKEDAINSLSACNESHQEETIEITTTDNGSNAAVRLIS